MLYRFRIVETFLANGIALEKMNGCRTVLQRAGYSLTAATHLKPFIPKIEEREMKTVLAEMEGQFVSSAFDGTTRLGEAMNMVNRWCTADFKLVKRLTMFKTVLKHMNHKELARLIGEKLLIELKVSPVSSVPIRAPRYHSHPAPPPSQVTVLHHVAFERDSVSVNGCAVEKLCNLFDASEDILCICHTLCHMGEHIELSTLDKFMHH